MLYAFLASGLGSAIYIAYLLWSKGNVQNNLDKANLQITISNNAAAGWKQSYTALTQTLSSKDTQIQTLQDQNEIYLAQLKTSGVPGVFADLLQKRNT
jgi:Flp pilus assembly protein TadG